MNFNPTSDVQLINILDNAVLAWGLLACGIAQFSKLLFELIFNQRWRPSVLIETGGMPSSHSALVTGAASCVGYESGFDSPIFALAVTFAFVVMYDASGIRKASGEIAARVNKLPVSAEGSPSENPLKEKLGHTRLEVFVGSLIGPAIALPGIVFIGSPIDFLHMLAFSSSW